MIAPHFNQRLRWQATLSDQKFGMLERNHIVFTAMQNQGIRLEQIYYAPILPSGTKQNQRRVTTFDIHRHRTASRAADDNIRSMSIEFFLRHMESSIKIIIIQLGIDNLMPSLIQKRRLDSTNDATPAM